MVRAVGVGLEDSAQPPELSRAGQVLHDESGPLGEIALRHCGDEAAEHIVPAAGTRAHDDADRLPAEVLLSVETGGRRNRSWRWRGLRRRSRRWRGLRSSAGRKRSGRWRWGRGRFRGRNGRRRRAGVGVGSPPQAAATRAMARAIAPGPKYRLMRIGFPPALR